MSNTFFFFGSLCDDDVLEIVVGRRVPKEHVQAATLSGFRACAVMLDREMVPVLLEEENGATRGVLVAELTDEDVRRISHFEGLDYKAGRCTVTLDNGNEVTAQAWLSSGFAPRSSQDWDFDVWRATQKPVFLKLAASWMSFYNRGDLDNTDFEAAERAWDRVLQQWGHTLISDAG